MEAVIARAAQRMHYLVKRPGAFGLLTLLIALLSLSAWPVWATQQRTQSIAPQQGAPTSTLASVPATKEELGRLLFFDPRLSGDAEVSCATCHMPDKAWGDGMALSAGYTGTLYFRNTPSLLNASQMAVLDWDGRFDRADMDSLVRDHLSEAHFMNIDGGLAIERVRQVPEYEEGFKTAFGGEVSYGRILSTLSAFVATLTSQGHPYQKYLQGDTTALSTQAQRGLGLFQGKAGCSQCHGGTLLSDGAFHVLGVTENPEVFHDSLRHITFRRFFRLFGVSEYATMREDPGLYALTLDDADWGKFRTPSLLEAARTAPYMHNGVFATLEEVVEFYNQGGGDAPNKSPLLRSLGLTPQEVADLVAFLASLASEEGPFDVPTVPLYQPRKLGEN